MLRELLRRAEGGETQGVGLVGEPGVGKSRLLYEFLRTLETERVSHIEGRCLSHGSAIPYLSIVELVRCHFGVIDTDPPSAIAGKIQEDLKAWTWSRPRPAATFFTCWTSAMARSSCQLSSPDAVRDRTLETLKQVIKIASRRRPLVIVVDDLHWADPTSEEVLASLLESLAAFPLMLLTTYRPGYRPGWLSHSYASQLVVTRLTRTHSSTIVRSVRPDLSSRLVEAIAVRGDGVPFFLEELARAVANDVDLSGVARR